MKRIITLVLVAAFVLGSFAQANATDIKTYGFFHNSYGFVDNSSFRDINEDDFRATIRLRGWVEFIASEALKGVYAFQVGNLQYGRAGAALDTTGTNVATRFLYIDWLVPNTSLTFRMGLQNFGLPAATSGNSPVHSANAAGIVGNYKFNDNVSLTGFWFRPFDEYGWYSPDSQSNPSYDAMDMYGLVLPMSFDGFKISPWLMYSNIGGDSGFWNYRGRYSTKFPSGNTPPAGRSGLSGAADMYHGGIATTISVLDPFTIKFDAMYGSVDNDNNQIESAGWWTAMLLEYKFDWGTPAIIGWYSSGDDADAVRDLDFGRIPVVGTDDGVNFTSFGMYGNSPLATGNTAITTDAVGLWGVGLRLWNLSFVKDLTHNFGVYYMQGTNNVENGTRHSGRANDQLNFMGEAIYMTTSDNAWEVDLTNRYKIYENFAVWLELGYIHLSMDENVWGDEFSEENAWKAQLGFEYKF